MGRYFIIRSREKLRRQERQEKQGRGFTRIRLRRFFFFGLHPKNKKHFKFVLEHKWKPLNLERQDKGRK